MSADSHTDFHYSYVDRVLIGFDQFINTLAGGMPDETISARCYRLDGKKKVWTVMRKVVDTLFFFQQNHCKTAYESEFLKRQYPSHYRHDNDDSKKKNET